MTTVLVLIIFGLGFCSGALAVGAIMRNRVPNTTGRVEPDREWPRPAGCNAEHKRAQNGQ